MITRADIAGAIKLLHSNNIVDRRGHIRNMVAAEHPPLHVAKIMSDLESYATWADRPELDVAPSSVSAVPAPAKKKKK